MMDRLDCSQPPTCRRFPGASTERDGAGTERRIHLNSLGFRGVEPPDDTDPAPRVAVFGDSMVFGTGVDDADTLPAQLERILSEKAGVPVHVLNFGMPMNGVRSAAANLSLHARALDPDVLVFASPGAGWLGAEDVHDLMAPVRESPLLSSIRNDPWGRWVVNRWVRFLVHRPGAEAQRRADAIAALSEVAREAAAKGRLLAVLDLWRSDAPGSAEFVASIPGFAQALVASAPYTRDEYRSGPWMIVGDGHPTAEGHRVTAEALADVLAGPIKARSAAAR